MSRKLLCFMSLVLVSVLATQATAQIDPATVTDGHVYLAGGASGGVVPDSSAVGHTANINGDPVVVDILGGRALQFDGVDDGVHILVVVAKDGLVRQGRGGKLGQQPVEFVGDIALQDLTGQFCYAPSFDCFAVFDIIQIHSL